MDQLSIDSNARLRRAFFYVSVVALVEWCFSIAVL